MGSEITNALVTVIVAIIGVAIIALIFSNQSNSVNVIKTSGSVLTSLLSTAVNPYSGGNTVATGLT